MVAASGSWWQGTLDAFGVGFIVGGLVDVVAVSLLNRVANGTEETSAEKALPTPGMVRYADDQQAPRILGYLDKSGAVVRSWCRSWVLHTGQQVVLLAGFALIAVGVGCLFLSGTAAASGSWWQGTLDAFGFGLVVGGLVDVVAASLLNRAVNETEEARQNSLRARRIQAELDKSDAVVQSQAHLWVLGSGQLVVLLAGFALIMVGVGCLFLSGMVAASGSWWQGALDAFGVGFVVGGLVDVVAVSLLNWVVNGAEIVRHNSVRAIDIFQAADKSQKKEAAAKILAMSDGQIFDDYREALLHVMIMSDAALEAKDYRDSPARWY